MRNIIIGTRGSKLALWQANYTKDLLAEKGVSASLKLIKTQGDKIQHLSFDKLEGKGFFTKEIEHELLTNQIDIAVHSHKDLETTPPEGLIISAVPVRANPNELLLINPDAVDESQIFDLKENPVVGTSSARRKMQLLAQRNDIELKDLRGNVPTRIEKLRARNYDAIVLAAAGVERLEIDLSDLHVIELSPQEFIPAPAQGALAFQTRANDEELNQFMKGLNNEAVSNCTQIERKVLNLLEGGCQLPFGMYCQEKDEIFEAWATFAEGWDKAERRIFARGKKEELAAYVHHQLHQKTPKKVFISRDPEENIFKERLAQAGHEVEAISLIEIKTIPLESIPNTDWLFFSSSNGVRSFFNQLESIPEQVKIGVMGAGTAKALKAFGLEPQFMGNGLPEETSTALTDTIESESILFVGAKSTLGNLEKHIPATQKQTLVVYETLEKTQAIDSADVYVFTSPSNVNAYSSSNKITDSTKIVAIGPSTAKRIQELYPDNELTTAYAPTPQALADTVLGII